MADLIVGKGLDVKLGNIAAGSGLIQAASGVLSALALGAANTKLFINAAGTAPEFASGFYVNRFDRDAAGANADVAYTGIGFKPSAMILFTCLNSGAQLSLNLWTTPVQWGVHFSTAWWPTGNIDMYLTGGRSWGTLKSFDADGFTITWSKTTNPTGTLNVSYMCLR
jgi:hypothetical protein